MLPESEKRLRLNARLLPALAGLALILQLVAPYRGWMILLVGLGGALLTSYLWARSLSEGLRLTREMRFGWAQVGDRVEERFTLLNDNPLPALWVEVVDHSTMPGYHNHRVAILGGQDSTRWRTKGICTQRGLFTLGPTSLSTGDPLGIFTAELDYPGSIPFMVMPPVVSLPSIDVASGGRAGEGRPRLNAPERTASAATVREYLPGDSPRWIHWRTSARRESLYVRLFEGVPAGDWWILLDMNQRVQVGQGLDATEEHGVILAASLADRGLRSGKAVGLVTHGEELVWLSPRGGEGRRWEILRALALIGPGECPLSEGLTQIGPAFGRYASLVIITPDLRSQWVEALVPLIRQDIIPTVLLLDRASFGEAGQTSEGTARAEEDARATVRQATTLLSGLGIAHHVISRDFLDRSAMQPGKRGHWEWRVLGTGHAVPVRRPQEAEWRGLS
ncbi:MAG: DUF58 domain-containing protein [Gemmatimonadales bacterium]|jgi:uncharacterized protein (DUF58 family)